MRMCAPLRHVLRSADEEAQLLAAHTATNMAAISPEVAEQMAQVSGQLGSSSLLEALVALVKVGAADTAEQAVWALGNLAAQTEALRDAALQAGAVTAIADHAHQAQARAQRGEAAALGGVRASGRLGIHWGGRVARSLASLCRDEPQEGTRRLKLASAALPALVRHAARPCLRTSTAISTGVVLGVSLLPNNKQKQCLHDIFMVCT